MARAPVWHPIFAILPHRLDNGRLAWLRRIERRHEHCWPGLRCRGNGYWRYREVGA